MTKTRKTDADYQGTWIYPNGRTVIVGDVVGKGEYVAHGWSSPTINRQQIGYLIRVLKVVKQEVVVAA